MFAFNFDVLEPPRSGRLQQRGQSVCVFMRHNEYWCLSRAEPQQGFALSLHAMQSDPIAFGVLESRDKAVVADAGLALKNFSAGSFNPFQWE